MSTHSIAPYFLVGCAALFTLGYGLPLAFVPLAWARVLGWEVRDDALTIYLVSRFVNFDDLAARFFGGEIAATLNALWPGLAGRVLALTGIGLCLALCRFLYVRKIFLRI